MRMEGVDTGLQLMLRVFFVSSEMQYHRVYVQRREMTQENIDLFRLSYKI